MPLVTKGRADFLRLWKVGLPTGMLSARFSSFLLMSEKLFIRPMPSKVWTVPTAAWTRREAYFPAQRLWWRLCIWLPLKHQKNGLWPFETRGVSTANWALCTKADCPNNKKQACQKSWKIRIFLTCLHLVIILSVRLDRWIISSSAFKSYHRKPIYRKFFILSGNTSIGSKEVEGVFLIANSMLLAIS